MCFCKQDSYQIQTLVSRLKELAVPLIMGSDLLADTRTMSEFS